MLRDIDLAFHDITSNSPEIEIAVKVIAESFPGLCTKKKSKVVFNKKVSSDDYYYKPKSV